MSKGHKASCFRSGASIKIKGDVHSTLKVQGGGVSHEAVAFDAQGPIDVEGTIEYNADISGDARPEVVQTGDVKVYEDNVFKDAFKGVTWQSDLPPYKLNGKCYVLIIGNIFEGDKDLFREGGEKDVSDMRNLFRFLQCEYMIKEKVTGAGLKRTLDAFKKELVEVKDEYGSCIVIIMSHGGISANSILMEDMTEMNLYRDIVYEFSHDRFPEFQNKPKIFLVQACQNYGDQDIQRSGGDKGMQLKLSSEEQDIPKKRSPGQSKDSQMNTVLTVSRDAVSIRDVLVSSATTPYHVALRTGHGSFFIQAIDEEFRKYAKEYTLRYMLHKVEENVLERCRKYNEERVKRGEVERKEQNVSSFESGFKTYKFKLQ